MFNPTVHKIVSEPVLKSFIADSQLPKKFGLVYERARS